MEKSPLKQLYDHGQSAWLDYIQRELISSGEFTRLIEEDAIKGITTNPAIFQKAISDGDSYKDSIHRIMTANPDHDERDLFVDLAIEDIQAAAGQLKKIYKETGYRDGYVSMEVSPDLAYDTDGTIQEARYLYKKVNRKNIMIKVPATREGLPAIEELIADGINVNATLLFSVERYKEVAEAFIRGLEKRSNNGGDITQVASVASFFVSRVDTLVDKLLQERLTTASADTQKIITNLKGRIAIANAKVAYASYQDIFNTPRFQALRDNGGQTQRLLWASTGVKNPNYSDVLYVNELIGPDTVNTMPQATLSAFKDHGQVANTLQQDLNQALQSLALLPSLELDLDAITTQLEKEGVRLFIEAFEQLLATLKQSMQSQQQQVSS